MPTIELTAKNVQEATKIAAEKLGASEDAINVTVLEEVKGLFGKSTVRVRAESAEPKAVTAPKKSAPKAAVVEAPVEEDKSKAEPKKVGRGRKTAAGTTETPKETIEDVQVAVEGDQPESTENGEATGPDATAEDGERLLGMLNGIIQSGKLDVKAEVTQISGRYVNIKLDGKDVAYIVGKHGEVLNALQYLLNIVAARQVGNGVRATLDGNDFRKRREDKLTGHAKMVADEVIKRGEEAVLDAMPAFDRRIVHKALSEYPGVATYSEGEEPNRRVVIAPAD